MPLALQITRRDQEAFPSQLLQQPNCFGLAHFGVVCARLTFAYTYTKRERETCICTYVHIYIHIYICTLTRDLSRVYPFGHMVLIASLSKDSASHPSWPRHPNAWNWGSEHPASKFRGRGSKVWARVSCRWFAPGALDYGPLKMPYFGKSGVGRTQNTGGPILVSLYTMRDPIILGPVYVPLKFGNSQTWELLLPSQT